jgi:hypothetical protein
MGLAVVAGWPNWHGFTGIGGVRKKQTTMQQLAHTPAIIASHLSPEFTGWLNKEKTLAHRRQQLAFRFGLVFLFFLVLAFMLA